MRSVRFFLIGTLLFLLLGSAAVVVVAEYDIDCWITPTGEGSRDSANYMIEDTIGETGADTMESQHFTLVGGLSDLPTDSSGPGIPVWLWGAVAAGVIIVLSVGFVLMFRIAIPRVHDS